MSFSSKLNIEILFQIVNKKCLHFDCDHRHERFHLKTHTSQSQVNVIHPLDSRPHVRDRTGTADAFVQLVPVHGPLTRYAILWVAHAPGMFSSRDARDAYRDL